MKFGVPKIKMFCLFLVLFTCIKSYSQTVIASQSFDAGASGYADNMGYTVSNGTYVNINSSTFESSPNSLRFSNNNGSNNRDSDVVFNTVNISGYTDVEVTISFKSINVDNGEDLVLYLSYDGGSFSQVAKLIDGDNNNESRDWGSNDPDGQSINSNPYTFSVPNAGYTTLEIQVQVENLDDNELYYIDNVIVEGTLVSTPEINVQGNSSDITDGDGSPSTADHTDFGAVAVASGTIDRTFTIYNAPGTGALDVSSIVISGAHAGDFSLTPDPYTATIGIGGNDTFTVSFDPSAGGARNATITINNDDDDEGVYNFDITGFGNTPEINVQGGAPLADIADGETAINTTLDTDFGSIQTSSGSNSNTFTIQNTGTASLSVSNITLTGHTSDFSVSTNPAPTTISTAGSTTFIITFDPTVDGTRLATVSIANEDSDENPYTFNIQGVGFTPAPEINVQGGAPPADIADGETAINTTLDTDFGSIQTSSGSNANTFTIQNTGTATLSVGSITLTGHTSDFSVSTNPAPTTISAAASTTFIITFDPTADGTRSATVSIANDDADEGSYTFNIEGVGFTPAPEINITGNGTSISDGQTLTSTIDGTDFGLVNEASGTAVQTFTVENLGTMDLSVSTPTIGGTHAGDFSISANPSSPVSASGSTTFNVTFDPSATGVRTATISVVNDDSDENPYTFNIEGEGVDLATVSSFGPDGDWKYLADGSDQGTAWRAGAFDDSSWLSGFAELGYGEGDETTDVGFIWTNPPTNDEKNITTYFRKSFVVSAADLSYSHLILNALIDDGMVVYLNGTEVWRDNITGAVSYTTTADGEAVEDVWISSEISNALVLGTNVIAVEVHQRSDSSSDVSFNMSLELRNYPIASGGSWSYEDTNTDMDASWLGLAYDYSGWAAGNTPLGYGEGQASDGTYGEPLLQTYFKKNIIVSAADAANSTLILNAIRDDAMVVYINGVEVWRDNITGSEAFGNPADGAVADEADWITTSIQNVLLVGSNEISVKILNESTGSSDLNFDFSMYTDNSVDFVPEINLTGNGMTIFNGDASPSLSDHTDFGATNLASGAIVRTFTIENLGYLDLTLDDPSPYIVITGDTADFTLTSNPSTPISGGGATTFDITFDPTVAGLRTAVVSIANNDSDEPIYTFEIQGSTSIIDSGGVWTYLDDGSDQGTTWYTTAFPSTGNAILGYGTIDPGVLLGTTVGFIDTDLGTSGTQKNITTYFTKTFTVTASEVADNTMNINIIRDDGAVVYINGIEVIRDNMPLGTIDYTTLASGAIGGDDESAWNNFKIPNSYLVVGTNTVAVEIHQRSETSSDISFDLQLYTNDDYIFVPPTPPDSDGDLVSDFIDTDDDNDGVPDVVEGCQTAQFEELSSDPTEAHEYEESILSDFPFSKSLDDGIRVDYSITGTFSEIASYNAGEQGWGIRVFGNSSSGTLTLDFRNDSDGSDTTIEDLFFKLVDFDEQETWTVNAYDDTNSLIDLTTSNNIYHLGSYIEQSGNTFADGPTTTNVVGDNVANDALGAIYFYFPSTSISRLEFVIEQPGSSTIRLAGLQYCTLDTDGDGISDDADSDSDNDGIPDIVEAGGYDTDGDGMVDTLTDTDGDGIVDIYDTDSSNYNTYETSTIIDYDFDGDGIPSRLDLDSDNDGIVDLREAGEDDTDFDGQIDGFTDADGDGYHDSFDGVGSILITGDDSVGSDGIPDSYPDKNPDGTGLPNFMDIDADGDGITDNTEAQETGSYVSAARSDTDSGGIIDGIDDNYDNDDVNFGGRGIVPIDKDSDGTPDYLDDDSDNDLELDIIEGHDANGDGTVDASDLYTCLTAIEANTGLATTIDTDGDGLDDGFDNDLLSYDFANAGMQASSHPNIDDIATSERDWREADIEYNLVDFDGVNDYIDFADQLNLSSSFTIQAWIKQDASSTGDALLVSKRDCNKGTNLGYHIGLENHFPVVKWYSNLGTETFSLVADHDIDTDRWYHITVTYDEASTTARIFVDGIQVGVDFAVAGPPEATNQSFILGAKFDNSDVSTKLSGKFHGWMDEIRVWNVALSVDQIRIMMNQEIELSGSDDVQGKLTPRAIDGISWSNLLAYYSMNTSSGRLTDDSSNTNHGKIRNITTAEEQTAPIPYVTSGNGSWSDGSASTPWTHGNTVWDVPNSLGIDDATRIDWPIIVIDKDSVNIDSDVNALAVIVDSDALITDEEITDGIFSIGASGGSHVLNISYYLRLDGKLDLYNESQLIQTEGSWLAENSKGYLERDQQGTQNSFTYNYWSAPVSQRSTVTNNTPFSVSDVLRDGTAELNPKLINFNYNYSHADGALTNPRRIATYWIWKFVNLSNDYSQWTWVGENLNLNVTEGYSMKGTSGSSTIATDQNYTFRGKPNNVANGSTDLVHTTFPGDFDLDGNPFISLTGNPFPSALDADAFIDDNIDGGGSDAISGTLYFWEHWSDNTHILKEYQGGYATYTKAGGVPATSHPDIDQGGSGSKTPGQFIPVGQGFFVTQDHDFDAMGDYINPSSGSVVFKNSQRVFEVEASNSESVFARAQRSPNGPDTNGEVEPEKDEEANLNYQKQRIWLNVKNPEGYTRQLLTAFINGATDAVDRGYEAAIIDKLPSDGAFIMEDRHFNIVAFESFHVEREIPIVLVANENQNNGRFEISLNRTEHIDSEISLYIKDNQTEEYVDLRSSSFKIALDPGSYSDRFSLVFQKEQSAAEEVLEEEKAKYEGELRAFYTKNANAIAIHKALEMKVSSITLVNSLGQTIQMWKSNLEGEHILLPISGLSTGVYLLSIEIDNQFVSKKIVLD